MRHRLIFLVLCVFLISGWSYQPAVAQENGWGIPMELSPPHTTEQNPDPSARKYGSSWFADLAIGPEGSVHVIWYSGVAFGGDKPDSIDLLMYRELRNGKWSEINEIAAPTTGGYTIRNNIIFARDGKLHVVFRNRTEIMYFNAPWDKAWSAQSWNTPQLLSGNASYYVALESDNKGALHAFWSEAMPSNPTDVPNEHCSGCADLIYRRSTNGGALWSTETNLSRTSDGENRPQVKIDQNDRIHIVWDKGVDWAAGQGEPQEGIYRRSDDGGLSWTNPISFTLPANAVSEIERRYAAQEAEQPNPTPTLEEENIPKLPPRLDAVQQTSLALDEKGNPFVVFRGVKNDYLYFQRSTDGGATWSQATQIPGIVARDINDNNLDIYSMTTDGAGNIHLVLVGFLESAYNPFQPSSPTLLYLNWNGTQWSTPEQIVNNDLYPEYPRTAIFAGNQLHIVWFTRSLQDLFKSDEANYRVWYSSKTLNAPTTGALPIFTPVPTALPTPTSSPPPSTPTPTPLSQAALHAPPMTDPPAWEGPGIAVIGLALAPSLGIIALIFVTHMVITRNRNRR